MCETAFQAEITRNIAKGQKKVLQEDEACLVRKYTVTIRCDKQEANTFALVYIRYIHPISKNKCPRNKGPGFLPGLCCAK